MHQKEETVSCGDSYTCFLNDNTFFVFNHIDFKYFWLHLIDTLKEQSYIN